MRHNIRIEGLIYRLRPITLQDAGLIVELRSDTEMNRFLHPIALSVSEQEKYLTAYFEREGDYYFVIERISTGVVEGLISLYNVDKERKNAEFGRWILRRKSQAAIESAVLLYRIAFEQLKLDKVYCLTIANNKQVVSFHKSFGLIMGKILQKYFVLNGVEYDAIEQYLTKDIWNNIQANLSEKIFICSRLMR